MRWLARLGYANTRSGSLTIQLIQLLQPITPIQNELVATLILGLIKIALRNGRYGSTPHAASQENMECPELAWISMSSTEITMTL